MNGDIVQLRQMNWIAITRGIIIWKLGSRQNQYQHGKAMSPGYSGPEKFQISFPVSIKTSIGRWRER